MCDLVKFLWRLTYYESRLLGMLNFEIDLQTGRARCTPRAWTSALIVNLLVLSGILSQIYLWHSLPLSWSINDHLMEYLFLTTFAVRLGCVSGTIVSRWSCCHRLVRLTNAFQRLALERPQVVALWRRRVLAKLLSATSKELMQFTVFLYSNRNNITYKGLVIFYAFLVTSLLTELITYQYDFALLNVHCHYVVLNRELREILRETRSLQLQRRKATLMIECCRLADRLECIASTQTQLQCLVEHIASLFGIPSLCESVNYIVYTICMVYFVYNAYRRHNVIFSWTSCRSALIVAKVCCYLIDVFISAKFAFILLDAHAEMIELLAEQSDLGLNLDERLVTVFQSFAMQMSRKPLKLPVLKLFNMKRAKALAMASYIFTNSIVVIQYDMQHYQGRAK
ncbi:hypothetical protein KR093_003278 [Drosophila rubida]|uniref:Gustatory receptor n=1 Tax=Drosophila rubida TaxID=30044 RepID=A0AAD4JQZ0_9MUSC|nr:hypothetical protein KR093_003278 [Drosophila rubida]